MKEEKHHNVLPCPLIILPLFAIPCTAGLATTVHLRDASLI